jgi:small subunit ribosomal protein S20
MAHNKQAKKRIRTNNEARIRNKDKSSAMKTQVKKLQGLIDAKDKAGATKELPGTFAHIDKCAKHRIIHPNTAARKKALLAKRVNAIA